jgi:hypothetical protein
MLEDYEVTANKRIRREHPEGGMVLAFDSHLTSSEDRRIVRMFRHPSAHSEMIVHEDNY